MKTMLTNKHWDILGNPQTNRKVHEEALLIGLDILSNLLGQCIYRTINTSE